MTRSVPTVRWAYCVDCGCVAPAEKVNNFDGFYKPDEQEDALNRAISAWNRRAQPANEPLTLDELRGMDGEPVWVVCGIYADWRIQEFIDEGAYKGFIKFSDRSAEPISDYGKNWLAYRYPPERSENDA